MNPFNEWRQCFGAYGRDARGKAVRRYRIATAYSTCAVGRLFQCGIPDREIVAFTNFFAQQQPAPPGKRPVIVYLNDSGCWGPAEFAAAWEEFKQHKAGGQA